MRNFLTFAALFALPAAAFAQAQGAPTIAVAEVTARGNVDPDLASEASDALIDQLVADARFRVVERQQIAKVMKEQMLAQSGAMSDEVQIRIAQLVGARFIVLGTVAAKGAGYAIGVRALDSSTGQVAFAQTLKVGSDEQIEAGSKQLARRLAEKLAGPPANVASTSSSPAEIVGDFDPAEVRQGAQVAAQSLAMRFPKLTGRILNALPNGTASCAFDSGEPFKGEFFEVSGRDDVTEQDSRKGWFLLSSWSRNGCSGRFKREGGIVEDGDTLTSVPVKIAVEAVQPGPGTQPELASLLVTELRAALDSYPQFQVTANPQLTATGRVSGTRGRRSIELQVVDKTGTIIQKVNVPTSF